MVAILALMLVSLAHAVGSSSPQQLSEQDSRWQQPCAEFAKQIAALTGPGTVTLTVENRSSLPGDDVPLIRRALERELRSAGVVTRTRNADSDVRVSLSQNMQGWLWVAEVQEGSETKVAMLPIVGTAVAGAGPSEPVTLTLHSDLIQAQAEAMLDVAVLGTPADAHLIVLEPEHIRAYSRTSGTWQMTQSFDIVRTRAFPRDARGRLVPVADHLFDAFLPGLACTATKAGDNWTVTFTCKESDDPWPLGSQKAVYNAARNFFTGVLLPGFGPKLPPFYSAAELARGGNTAFLFADVTGAVHILEGGSHKLLIGARDWGSDIAAVRSECGSGMQVLASAAGWPAADSVRAYEISGREAKPASAPLTFPGTITSMWTAADQKSAVVVVQNAQESRYEAYSVSVACSR